jgi:uncharacterized membrane protein (DUF373 family)
MKTEDVRPPSSVRWLSWLLERFVTGVVLVLIVLMMGVIALATLDLAWRLVEDVLTPPVLRLEVQELLDLFGLFLLILIGLELLETTRVYLRSQVMHLEVVIEVALIALARKVIVLDTAKEGSITVLGLAALTLALAVAFYLHRRAQKRAERPEAANEGTGALPY